MEYSNAHDGCETVRPMTVTLDLSMPNRRLPRRLRQERAVPTAAE